MYHTLFMMIYTLSIINIYINVCYIYIYNMMILMLCICYVDVNEVQASVQASGVQYLGQHGGGSSCRDVHRFFLSWEIGGYV